MKRLRLLAALGLLVLRWCFSAVSADFAPGPVIGEDAYFKGLQHSTVGDDTQVVVPGAALLGAAPIQARTSSADACSAACWTEPGCDWWNYCELEVRGAPGARCQGSRSTALPLGAAPPPAASLSRPLSTVPPVAASPPGRMQRWRRWNDISAVQPAERKLQPGATAGGTWRRCDLDCRRVLLLGLVPPCLAAVPPAGLGAAVLRSSAASWATAPSLLPQACCFPPTHLPISPAAMPLTYFSSLVPCP